MQELSPYGAASKPRRIAHRQIDQGAASFTPGPGGGRIPSWKLPYFIMLKHVLATPECLTFPEAVSTLQTTRSERKPTS